MRILNMPKIIPDEDLSQLAIALRNWSPFVSSGYEVPAAGTVMFEAAQLLGQYRSALTDLAEAARNSCDARLHTPLIEALAEADRILAFDKK
jgi:hypothetical protein